MQCGGCGNAIEAGAAFCGHCGSPVAGPPLQQNAPIPASQPPVYPQQPPYQPRPITPGNGNALKIIIFVGVGLFLLIGIGVVLLFVFSSGNDDQDNREATASDEEELSEIGDPEPADPSETDSGDENGEPAENDAEPDLAPTWTDNIVSAQRGLAALDFECESLTVKESIEKEEESSLFLSADTRELYERYKQASFSSDQTLECRHGEHFFDIGVMLAVIADAIAQEAVDFVCESATEHGLSSAEIEEFFEDWGEDSPGDDVLLQVGSLVIGINPYTVESLEELLDDAEIEHERHQFPEPGC